MKHKYSEEKPNVDSNSKWFYVKCAHKGVVAAPWFAEDEPTHQMHKDHWEKTLKVTEWCDPEEFWNDAIS